MNNFEQPKLEGANTPVSPPVTETAPVNSGEVKLAEFDPARMPESTDDELSQALADSRKSAPVTVAPEKPRGPGKYQLAYVYNGEPIHETHETLRLALARIAALKRIGITPATHTTK